MEIIKKAVSPDEGDAAFFFGGGGGGGIKVNLPKTRLIFAG